MTSINKTFSFARPIFDREFGATPPAQADRLLLRMLDESDHGMVLVDVNGRPRISNAGGRREAARGGALQFLDGFVTTSEPCRRTAFCKALIGASMGRRQLRSSFEA